MNVAAILFAVAAVTGIAIAFIRLSGRDLPPIGLAILHGLFAASGLVALTIVAVAPGAAQWARISLGIFVVAALGGFVLFSFHLRRRALPVPIIAIHGFVAVIAFVVLLVAIFRAHMKPPFRWFLNTNSHEEGEISRTSRSSDVVTIT